MKFSVRALLQVAGLLVLSHTSAGCGPVCVGTQGSCLDLRVDTRDSFRHLFFPMTVSLAGTNFSGAAVVATGTTRKDIDLPVELLLQPPSTIGQVQAVAIQVLDPFQNVFLAGVVPVDWPVGKHIQASINLVSPVFGSTAANATGIAAQDGNGAASGNQAEIVVLTTE